MSTARIERDDEPGSQPERGERRLREPTLRDLSFRDYRTAARRAAKELLDDQMPMLAQAVAFGTFLAIPSLLLVAVGLFSLVASPSTIDSLVNRLGDVAPQQAVGLLGDSLHRLDQRSGTGVAITIVGFAVALWSATGAVNGLMTALNVAYDRKDERSFLRRRLVALQLLAFAAFALVLVLGLLVLGPHLSRWVGNAVGLQGAMGWIWWVAQWPILVVGVLASFAALLYLGPDVKEPRLRFVTAGSLVAMLAWLALSGAFAFYASRFGSYNKAWGSLAAVIVMLTWLWLSALALLFGAELNAELERSREQQP